MALQQLTAVIGALIIAADIFFSLNRKSALRRFPSFPLVSSDSSWLAVMQCRSSASLTASASLLPSPGPPRQPTHHPLHCLLEYFLLVSFTLWRMVLEWEAFITLSIIQPWEPRGFSASSHTGVSVGCPLKLGTQSNPPWSESRAAAPHNPYSKGQLD